MCSQPTVVIADRSEAILMYMAIVLDRLGFEMPAGEGAALIGG